jgi:hypothetical protein
LRRILLRKAKAKIGASNWYATKYLYSEVFDLKPTSGLYPGSGVLGYWSVVGGECLLYG